MAVDGSCTFSSFMSSALEIEEEGVPLLLYALLAQTEAWYGLLTLSASSIHWSIRSSSSIPTPITALL